MASPPTYALTGKQKNSMHEAVEHAPVAPDFARTGKVNPNLRVFVANFDGTNNDRMSVPKGEQATLVANSFETYRDSDDSAVASRYYRGVGTRTSKVGFVIESGLGFGCARNAISAHEDLVRQVAIWRDKNPDIEVHVHVTGFSRGSATALHFMNMVNERGALSKGDLANIENTADNLRPCRVKTSAVLLDTVSTGQGPILNLTIPPTCEAVLHITAANEQRYFFPLREIAKGAEKELSFAVNANMAGGVRTPDGMIGYQRIQEVELPGVHSDIGGAYDSGGVRAVSQYLIENFQASLGLGVSPVKPSFEAIQNCRLHDERMLKLVDGVAPDPEKEREVLKAQKDTWDGIYVKRTTITSPEGAVSHVMEMGQVPMKVVINSNGQIESKTVDSKVVDLMYKIHEASISPQRDDCGSAHIPGAVDAGVVVLTDANDLFSVDEKGISALGQSMTGGCNLKSLREMWSRQEGTADGPKPMKVSFDIWRLGCMAHTSQDINCEPMKPVPQESDPWPQGLRNSISLLNTEPPMSAKLACAMMDRAQRSVAQALQNEFEGLKSVTIEPRTNVETTSQGRKLVNTFVMKVEKSDGTVFSSDQPASGKLEFDISNRMRSLRRGLGEINEGLRAAGFQSGKDSTQVFTNGNQPTLHLVNQKLMVPLSESGQTPFMVPKSFMQMMGSFVSNASNSLSFGLNG